MSPSAKGGITLSEEDELIMSHLIKDVTENARKRIKHPKTKQVLIRNNFFFLRIKNVSKKISGTEETGMHERDCLNVLKPPRIW
jgi:hypothetical protein